ncbi:hypothetical protein H5S40_08450 [Limosilactobacillus sp. RRLNB_1_1]|uniref:Uncharacterized protein n=1 Tax=Limosilactobacillus albertensis TaxID=2759752 RepID=A0A7W3Y8M7_9LACO|nr:hypothetical protein [Limosilactobacillus albertensis]MBB1070180.1 hypothetical protein [Limosilactobacillus albertensis]MCD7119224.1 hypothetical protein [Limosilactobacillus albertensis]MCD7129432.1 hypothetical protein [Limosilactobacillus albertensis]
MMNILQTLFEFVKTVLNQIRRKQEDNINLLNRIDNLKRCYQKVLESDEESLYNDTKEKEKAIEEFKKESEILINILKVKFEVGKNLTNLNIKGEYEGSYYINTDLYEDEQLDMNNKRMAQQKENDEIISDNRENISLVIDILDQLGENIDDVIKRKDSNKSKYLVSSLSLNARSAFDKYLKIVKQELSSKILE